MTSTSEKKARLLYCKSHVVVHPSAFNRDNVPGYLGIVEVDAEHEAVGVDEEGQVKRAQKELLVTWVPDELLERMDEEDREGYKRVEAWFSGATQKDVEEDGERFDGLGCIKLNLWRFRLRLGSSAKRGEVCLLSPLVRHIQYLGVLSESWYR